MPARHPLPRLWLMTDERMGEALWPALERVPPGTGVVFRHYRTAAAERRALYERVRRVARRRRLVLVLAGDARQAAAWRADGVHGRHAIRTGRPLVRTAPAHDRREAIAARRAGADLLFVSPLFATRSHPGARALGRIRFGGIVRGIGLPVIALGGMSVRRYRSVRALADGWAAIDAWTGDQGAGDQAADGQKRKVVPR